MSKGKKRDKVHLVTTTDINQPEGPAQKKKEGRRGGAVLLYLRAAKSAQYNRILLSLHVRLGPPLSPLVGLL